METRAHFVIIGLFTLFGILGGLGFFLWLASVQIDRQYAQYGVLFDNVSGLDQSAEVLFNGVPVGRVTGIRIWENDPSKAYVALEIDATTPVAVDTVARLESQGVTGVAYIALSGGRPDAALLMAEGDGPPIIPSTQSSFQSLVNSAPDLIADAARIIAQLEQLVGTENQEHVRSILENVDNATAGLDKALADFSDIADTLRDASVQVTGFVSEFDGVGGDTKATLDAADRSFAAITQTFENANARLDNLGPAMRDFSALGGEARVAVRALNDLIRRIGQDPSGFVLNNRVPEYRR